MVAGVSVGPAERIAVPHLAQSAARLVMHAQRLLGVRAGCGAVTKCDFPRPGYEMPRAVG
jgi:hypothetical protein